jgi:hypothetical protein
VGFYPSGGIKIGERDWGMLVVQVIVALQATGLFASVTQGVARRLALPWAKESRAFGAG